MTPTGNEKIDAQIEGLKHLILWCRRNRIHARVIEVDEVSLDFYDSALLKGDPIGPEGLTAAEQEALELEAQPRNTGSVDEHWAEQLGVDLNEGTKGEPV